MQPLVCFFFLGEGKDPLLLAFHLISPGQGRVLAAVSLSLDLGPADIEKDRGALPPFRQNRAALQTAVGKTPKRRRRLFLKLQEAAILRSEPSQ